MKNSTKGSSKNLLEWLSGRGFSDAVKTILIGVLATLTISPYLGGQTIWYMGSNPVTIPTVSADWIWFLIFFPPLIWFLVVVRLLNAPWYKVLITITIASIVSATILALYKVYPSRLFDSINTNFDEVYRIEFIDTQKSYVIASTAASFSYFNLISHNPQPTLTIGKAWEEFEVQPMVI